MRGFLGDASVIVRRNLVKVWRVPELMVFAVAQPILLVVLFAYVFGGSIDLAGDTTYREFLIAGVFVQTVVFGSNFTGGSIAEDMQKGVVDRFRSLPMARSALLVGRTASDIVVNVVSLVVMGVTGLAVGWRIHSSAWEALGGFALMLFFAYALSWVMAYIGLRVPAPELVTNASFMFMFPLTFVANTFVPLENLPGPLRTFAEWNPVSSATAAARTLFANGSGVLTPSDAWPQQHPVAYTLLAGLVLVAVFAPLSVRTYAKAGRR